MATNEATLIQELKDKKRLDKQKKQLENNNDLDYGITYYEDNLVTQALANGAQPNAFATYEDGTVDDSLPLIKAVIAQNVHAVNQLLAYGVNPHILDFDVPLLERAVETGNTQIVTALLTAQCSIDSYCKRSVLDAAITELADHALINQFDSSTWNNDSTERKLQKELQSWFVNTEQEAPNYPTPLRVKYFGDIKMIKLLLTNKIDASKPNIKDETPLMLVQNPQNYSYRFTRTYSDKPEANVVFLGCNENNILSFKMNLFNRNHTQHIPIIVDYDLSRIRTILEEHFALKAQTSHATEAERKAMADMATRVQTIEATTSHLKSETLPVIEKNKLKLQWKARKETLDAQPLTKLFCERVDSRLRSCIAATISLASDTGAHKIQRQKGTAEGILSETISLIGDQLGPFGGVVFKLIGTAVEFGIDKHYDDVYKRIAALFTFTDTENVCDKVAIATAEMYASLNTYPSATTSHVEKLADKTVAFVVYLMNNRHVVKLGADNPIENQIIDFFARSEFFKNCEPVLDQQRQEGEKASKKQGSNLLSKFKSLSPSPRSSAPAPSPTVVPQLLQNHALDYLASGLLVVTSAQHRLKKLREARPKP